MPADYLARALACPLSSRRQRLFKGRQRPPPARTAHTASAFEPDHRCFGPKIIDSWPSVVRSKNLSKLLDCAFSLVDLLKEVSMANFQQRLRYQLVCPLGLFG
jgi:hypothetical protein